MQRVAPVMAGVFTVAMLATIGLPGLNGFVGEFLILAGTFLTHRWWAVVATGGVVFAALYLLWAYQQAFHHEPDEADAAVKDLSWREVAVVAPLIAVILFLGIYPKPVLDRITPVGDEPGPARRHEHGHPPADHRDRGPRTARRSFRRGDVEEGAVIHPTALVALTAPKIHYLADPARPRDAGWGHGAAGGVVAVAPTHGRHDRHRHGRHDGLAALSLSLVQWFDVADHGAHVTIDSAVVEDGFSALVAVLVSCAVLLSALVADGWMRREMATGPEFQALMLLSAVGAMIMASANDLIVVFLGLEILSIALYVLAAMNARRAESGEAALKYFVLGAFSSAVFLYGIALVYGATGSTNLPQITDYLARNVLLHNGLLLAGMALLLVGFGFKVAAVPFHLWTPDVYQGSPSPATGFMAAVAKAGGFAALLRVFVSSFGNLRTDWQPAVWVIAALTLLLGAVVALAQRDIKRMLAYSSINHAGFVLLGLQVATARGVSASLYYLFTYTFMVIGTFAVVTVIGGPGDTRHDLDNYRGPGSRRPWLAGSLGGAPDGPGRHPVHDRVPGQARGNRGVGGGTVDGSGGHRHDLGRHRRVLLPSGHPAHVHPVEGVRRRRHHHPGRYPARRGGCLGLGAGRRRRRPGRGLGRVARGHADAGRDLRGGAVGAGERDDDRGHRRVPGGHGGLRRMAGPVGELRPPGHAPAPVGPS